MSTISLKNEQWSKIVEFLRACPDVYVGQEGHCRRFVEGVLWIARSGAQWRLLPETYGHWNSVYKRFARWSDKGIWQRLHQHFADDPDLEHLILDSTIVRAHPCAAGALKKKAVKRNKPSAIVVVASVPKFTSASMGWGIRCAFC